MGFLSPPKPKAPPPPPNAAMSPINAGAPTSAGVTPSAYSSLISTTPTGLRRKANVERTSLIGGA